MGRGVTWECMSWVWIRTGGEKCVCMCVCVDMVEKLFGHILLDRLQLIAEKVLPESQSGSHKGRGCVDMIFILFYSILIMLFLQLDGCLRMSKEHDESVFKLFGDLRKTYDSISIEGLWQMLRKYDVHPVMLSLQVELLKKVINQKLLVH